MSNLFEAGGKVPASAKSRDHYALLHRYMDEISATLRRTMGNPGLREADLVYIREQVRADFRSNNLATDHYRNLERRLAEPLAEARITLVRAEYPTVPQGFITRLGHLLSDWIFEEHELDEFRRALREAGLPDDLQADLVPKLEAWVEEDRPLMV